MTVSRDPAATSSAGAASDGFRELLEPGAIRAVFQPIVRLSDLEPIGYEGLARFPTPPGLVALPPDVTLAASTRSGLRPDLEAACWAAIAEGGVPPQGRMLFVNASPDLIGHAGFAAMAERMPSRLVIELTEQDAVQNIALVRERLRPWIARGALVAVDDAGAGFTSLEYVAEIRPDFLKLCRGMVTGVDLDAGRHAVLRATVAFAREVGARIIAEGVERPEELAVLRDAGVDYGQGWLFGRPAAAWPPDRPEPAPPRVATARERGREPFARSLGGAHTVHAACAATVDHLARRGLLPSVYLEQGGRLRCQAVRGYWQIYDGMPPSAGLIGRAYRTGVELVVHDVGEQPEFLASLPSVAAQACFPLEIDGVASGVLSAESATPLHDVEVAELRRVAGLLGTRIEALGGVEAASPAQELARTLAALAALDDPEDIVRETLVAARGLSGFESALLALADGHGSLYPHHAEGSFAVALAELDAAELGRIAAWVDHGASCYTAGEATGRGFAGHEPLRAAGAGSVVVLPMRAAGRRVGVLLLIDRAGHRLATETVELLELLAVQAAGGLRMAAAVPELRERAARDPLTGLGHHATFHGTLPAVRAGLGPGRHCALLVADVDGLEGINDTRGHAAGDDVLRAAAGLLRAVAPPGGRAFRVGGDEFAIVFECASPDAARRVGWELQTRAPGRLGTSVSVGIALAAAGETDEALVGRADAALHGVKRQGRDGVQLASAPPVR
jgi:diguanylate cyclase (GGDEF)-like protein